MPMTSPLYYIARRCTVLLVALACAGVPLATHSEPSRQTATSKPTQSAKRARSAKAKAPAQPADIAGERVDFRQWAAVAEFEDQMVRQHGFERDALAALLAQVRYIDAAVQLIKPAPVGKPKNWQAYRARFIEPVRIAAGVAFWNAHADTLARAEAQYGVPADIIVGIIGVETVYGRNTGRFRVLDVLTTLAFAYPEAPNRAARMQFFRGELENTLLLARKTHIDPLSLLGSFAGAVGLPQFMPGSILAYGVDFDDDGQIDLRNSADDAIGSVAHFLQQHGWRGEQGEPIVFAANLAAGAAWQSAIGQGLTANYRAEELAALGAVSPSALPEGMRFGLIDLQNGVEATEYWFATNNFFAITHYNRSYFYAMSVLELGQAVRRARAG
ncbi:MAG: lytic murein transglycosylase B [Massilia sp.]|nr:lytic murein transglycosylase B [Massilia sp.]